MSSQPNHYEVLGLSPNATAEQIKRRYRELARRYHPDINSSPEAAHRILSVNQAYRVLGDAERRAAYDAEHAVPTVPPQPARPSPSEVHPSASSRPGNPPPAARGRVYYDGFGRAFSEPAQDWRPPPPRAAPSKPKRTSRPQPPSIDQLLAEARLAFINRDMRLAQRLCLEAIRSDPRSAMAHEILGDIYARDGDTQRAATAYSYAIQFNPRHAEAQAKLDRLMNTTGPAGAGPTITYGGRAARRAEPAPTSGGVLTLVTILAGAALLASPFWLAFSSGDPIASLFGGTVAFSANLLAALALAGAAGGILLAFYGRMRPFKDELWRRTGEDGSPTRVPLGLTLSLVALVWLYASFLAYIGLAARHNRFSPSILRAYAMTLALVLVFTVAYRPSAAGATGWSATLLAGNLLFPAVLAGWVMGDALRLRGQM